jgi:TPP-dependent pyruvate/acetoin dehydrogenase alpha subunit
MVTYAKRWSWKVPKAFDFVHEINLFTKEEQKASVAHVKPAVEEKGQPIDFVAAEPKETVSTTNRDVLIDLSKYLQGTKNNLGKYEIT